MANTQLIKDTVAFVAKTWPDITIDPSRVQGWINEVESGSGRTAEKIKADILEYVVGEDKVRAYVLDAFTSRNLTADDARIDRITGEVMNGRSFKELNETLQGYAKPSNSDTDTVDTTDNDPATPPEGEEEDIPGIKGGGTLTKVVRGKQDDLWMMTYVVDGYVHAYTFDSYEAMVADLGKDAVTSGEYGFKSMTESEYDLAINKGQMFNMGSATPLVGQTGSYANFIADIRRDAAISAGIRNPGALGDYYADPDIAGLIAAATAGDWTPDQLQAEIRNTSYYQDVMYPGISHILDQGVSNPEAAYKAYALSVKDSLDLLGYEKDDDGTYKSTIKRMLENGISEKTFSVMAPQFQRAKESPDFASALDYWMDQTAGRNVTFDDVFDAMSGQSTGDLKAAVEKAVIQYQSTITNTRLTPEQITRIANKTQLSEAEIATSFTTAEESLLALGAEGLGRYGLSEDALVSAAFGLQSQDGKTASEIRRTAVKTMKELGLRDDKKAQFYAGFDERGALIKPGLETTAPEAG